MQVRPWWLVGALALYACGGDNGGKRTGGDCPDSLSYATAAESFVHDYCSTCHGAARTGPARNGAPDDVDLDDEDDLFTHGTHVFEQVSARLMPPPTSAQPSAAERATFLSWMECSGAADSHDH